MRRVDSPSLFQAGLGPGIHLSKKLFSLHLSTRASSSSHPPKQYSRISLHFKSCMFPVQLIPSLAYLHLPIPSLRTHIPVGLSAAYIHTPFLLYNKVFWSAPATASCFSEQHLKLPTFRFLKIYIKPGMQASLPPGGKEVSKGPSTTQVLVTHVDALPPRLSVACSVRAQQV